MKTQIEIQKVLEYSDIFPDEERVDVPAVLKKYNREVLIGVVNVLGLNYGNAYMPDTTLFSKDSAKRVEELNERFAKYAPQLVGQRFCYCTLRTILEFLRNVFSIPVDEYLDNWREEDFEYDVFRVLIQLNEYLMQFSGGKEKINLPINMYFLCYVLNDVVGTNWKEACTTQILYFLKLKEFLEQEKNKYLCDKLCNKLGVKSLEKYLVTVFGLVSLYVSEQQKNTKKIVALNIENQPYLSKTICDYISLDVNATYPYDSENTNDRESNIDYRMFRSHPLIKCDDGKYYLYSLPLLCERIYNSLFFDLKPFYKGNFFQFYNSEFVEQYLFQNIMLECIGKKSTSFFPHKEDIGKAEEKDQPDFYIREQESIILFECKGIKINGTLKDKSDISELVAELKNKLYLSSTNIQRGGVEKVKANTVGVTQLVKLINLIEDDKFQWDKNIPDDVAYYPVLVIEDSKIVQLGLMSLINNWYQPLLNEQLAETVSYPIIVMSINTLFLYKDEFRRFGFSCIFNSFFRTYDKRRNIGIEWTLNPFADFNSYMKKNYKKSTSAVEYINKQIKSISKLQIQ